MWYFFVIFGVLSGIVGGMGMGGGTLLIPLLTIFVEVSQIVAQGFNLIAFLPMSIIAIIIHLKNNLVKLNGLFLLVIFGIVFAVLGSFLAFYVDKNLLKILFGSFLIVLSFIEFYKIFKK